MLLLQTQTYVPDMEAGFCDSEDEDLCFTTLPNLSILTFHSKNTVQREVTC